MDASNFTAGALIAHSSHKNTHAVTLSRRSDKMSSTARRYYLKGRAAILFFFLLWFARIAQREAFRIRSQTLTLPLTPHNRFKEVPFSFACLSPLQWYTLKSFDQDMQPDSGGEEERQQQEGGVENRDGGERQRQRERCSISSTPTHASHETPCSSSSLFIMLQTHTSSQTQSLLGTEFTHHLRIFGVISSPYHGMAYVNE